MTIGVDPLSLGWTRQELRAVCDVILGQSPPGSTYNTDREGLPFFQGKAEFGDLYPTAAKWCTAPTKVAQPDDVLISVRAPVGPTNLCPSIACIGRGLAALRPRDHMPARYLLYAMRATAPSLAAKATGSTFEAVSGETLRSHEIPVAPLEEQRAIVAEIEKQFTRLDAGVAALRRMQANLKRYRASVLKAACEGKLVPTEAELARKEGRTYETGEQLLQRILVERRKNWKGRGKYIEPSAPESTGLMPLPDGWVWTTLGSVTSIQGGIAKDQKRKHDAPARFVPYLRVANVQRGYLDLSEIKELSVTEAEVEELRLVPGDLLFNEGGDRDKLGRGWIWNGEIPECIHQNHVFRARLMKDSLHPKFVSWYANSFGQKFFFDEGKHTTNLASISMSKLRALPLPIPPPAEQARIIAEVERRLSVVDELDRTVSANLRRAIGLRKSVLQRAFSGALVKTETRPTAVAASATPPVSKQRRHFARAVLSGEIVHRLHGERTFGRVKHQKIFHLCEHIARLPEIQGEYHREAAGPLDNKLIYANTTELKKQKWYAQVDRAGTGHEYKALAKAGGHRKYAERLWRDQLPAVERLIEMMRTWTTERCEIFSTVYAAWNDLLLWGREATDDAIVHEILHRWHESKKRIPEDKWRAAIGWMRREGLVPTGFGRPTAAPGPDDAQASGR